MKKAFLIFAPVFLVSISAWMMTRDPGSLAPPVGVPAVVSQPEVVQREEALPPTQNEATPTGTFVPDRPKSEPQDPDLRSMTDSPTFVGKLAAARRIAGRQDENSFRILVGELVKAEGAGDPSADDFVRELSQLIGQMRGAQVQPIANELAYSASPTASRVAVDAAVASESSLNFQSLESGMDGNIERQAIADDRAQALYDAMPRVENRRGKR